jgi:hypothetical protein
VTKKQNGKPVYAPKRGDIFKTTSSVGVIVDTYISPDTGDVVLKVYSPNRVLRLQEPELVTLESLREVDLRPAAQDDLEKQLRFIFDFQSGQYQTRINEVLSAAGLPPVEVKSILGGTHG